LNTAQLCWADENRVAEIEADNLLLNAKVNESDSKIKVDLLNLEKGVGDLQKGEREKYAELNATIETLKQDIRVLKGEIEESALACSFRPTGRANSRLSSG